MSNGESKLTSGYYKHICHDSKMVRIDPPTSNPNTFRKYNNILPLIWTYGNIILFSKHARRSETRGSTLLFVVVKRYLLSC